MDQVQLCPVVHAESADASGILRNLGLMQDDVEGHKSISLRLIFVFLSSLFSCFHLYESDRISSWFFDGF
jgi:hypothetical protein